MWSRGKVGLGTARVEPTHGKARLGWWCDELDLDAVRVEPAHGEARLGWSCSKLGLNVMRMEQLRGRACKGGPDAARVSLGVEGCSKGGAGVLHR